MKARVRVLAIGAAADRSDSGSQVDRERMARLVHADLTATGQPEPGKSSPTLLGHLREELNSPGLQLLHRGIQIVAHEVQPVSGRTVRGMHSQFRRRQLEDQPAVTGVDMRLLEHLCEEVTVGFRIGAEHDDMTTNDHVLTLRGGLMQIGFAPW